MVIHLPSMGKDPGFHPLQKPFCGFLAWKACALPLRHPPTPNGIFLKSLMQQCFLEFSRYFAHNFSQKR
jgi:hypothetical protein